MGYCKIIAVTFYRIQVPIYSIHLLPTPLQIEPYVRRTSLQIQCFLWKQFPGNKWNKPWYVQLNKLGLIGMENISVSTALCTWVDAAAVEINNINKIIACAIFVICKETKNIFPLF